MVKSFCRRATPGPSQFGIPHRRTTTSCLQVLTKPSIKPQSKHYITVKSSRRQLKSIPYLAIPNTPDPRLQQITVDQLWTHYGGLNDSTSGYDLSDRMRLTARRTEHRCPACIIERCCRLCVKLRIFELRVHVSKLRGRTYHGNGKLRLPLSSSPLASGSPAPLHTSTT